MRTPSESQYPVLDNRPIDQWKVTELKEELKRRKLTANGLKVDLIKRLDEAIRSENETDEEHVDNDADEPQADAAVDDPQPDIAAADPQPDAAAAADPQPDAAAAAADDPQPDAAADDPQPDATADNAQPEVAADEPQPDVTADDRQLNDHAEALKADETGEGALSETSKEIEDRVDGSKSENIGAIPAQAAGAGSGHRLNNGKDQEVENTVGSGVELVSATVATYAEVSEKVCGSVEPERAVGIQVSQEHVVETEKRDSREQPDMEDVKLPEEDVKPDLTDPKNQVSEVSPSLGFPVKSDSVSTDYVSNNEKNDLKDNIIADNVKLEPDVKPEMVEPSSSDVVPDGGKSHLMDVEEPQDNKVSVEESNNDVTNVDMSKKNDSADIGSSEKLNLDRSSGDDSMEEDVSESKQIHSNENFVEVGGRSEKIEVPIAMEESLVDIMGDDLSSEKKDINLENKNTVAPSTEKRKLPDQEAVSNNDPSKRQRRWKSEGQKAAEPQNSATIKDNPPPVLKRSFSRSDSTGGTETPKEREVPPSTKPPTNSLRIDRFLRPFTLKAVQELLGRTGTVSSFWMDHIKTHCYVTYSSVEEAIETRNAVYNLQWPPNGGRLLVADFVDQEEVKQKLEAPSQLLPAPPSTASAPTPTPAAPPQPSPRQQAPKLPTPQQALPPPPPLPNPPPARERIQLPPPPPLPEKAEPPILTLDDLFRKTKATPRIYYLPLSEEQVSAKVEAQRRRNARQ